MTWTAPDVPPALVVVDGPTTGPERPILAGYLAWQRTTLLQACAGLTAEQLATASVPPSTLTLLGLVRHLAKVERIWWRVRLDREDVALQYPLGTDDDFLLLDPARAADEFDALYAEWEVCDAVAARHDLDDEFVSKDETMSVRMLYVHLIGEYAQHNGHADLVRERVLAGETHVPDAPGSGPTSG